ncbi:hypothetical protein EJB05_39515, partial [Eragrostis curvula]
MQKPLNNIILVSYGIKDSGKSISGELENRNCGFTCSRGSLALERDRFLWASMDYIREVIVMDNFEEELFAVSQLKFEFLEVAEDMDIYAKLPRLTLKEKFYHNFELELEYNSSLAFDHVASFCMQLEERISRPFREDQCDSKDDDPPFWGQVFCHRLPAMNRTTWSPPPKGWIKLNFHGIGCSKSLPASAGGIFHNDKGEVLSYYAAPVGDVDQIVASLMPGLGLDHRFHITEIQPEQVPQHTDQRSRTGGNKKINGKASEDLLKLVQNRTISKTYKRRPKKDLDENLLRRSPRLQKKGEGYKLIVASSKALELGLEHMIELHEPVHKLIIEGDNVTVIRWCNRITHPPERAKDSFINSFWCMDLRPCKAETAEDCNGEGGKNEDVGSKDKHEDDDSKGEDEDDCASQGASSRFVIPPGWASREYIAWRVEEEANQVAIGLASLGRFLPEHMLHLSTACECGHGMDMKKDKPDITWFNHDIDEGLLNKIKTLSSRIL